MGKARDPVAARVAGACPRDLVALQRSVGNAAVGELLAATSKRSTALAAPAIQRADDGSAEPGDFYGIDDISNASVDDLVEALDNGAVTLTDLGEELSESKKLKLLRAAVKHGATGAMWEIWASFANLEEVAAAHSDLWLSCVEAGAGLYSLPAVAAVEADFRSDVAYVRDVSLLMSREAAEAELARYGLTGAQTGLSPDVAVARQQAIDSFQAAATVVAAALEAQELLRNLPIGYEIPVIEDYGFGEGEPDSFDPAAEPTGPEPVPVRFDPLDSAAADIEFDVPSEYAWFELKDVYDEAADVIAYWSAKVPALYAILAGGTASGQLLDLTDMANQHDALNAIERSVRGVLTAIESTEQAGIDPLDLKPIHRRLYTGAGQDIGTLRPWDTPFYGAVAKNLVDRHESGDWWTVVGLGLAAASIIVTFAVAGPAGFVAMAVVGGVSAGVGAAEAASRFQKADELAVAADARMRDDWAIVDADQAAAERAKAQLALIFAALDAMGVGPELRSLRAASAAANVSDELLQSGARAGKQAPEGGPTLEQIKHSEVPMEPGHGTPATGQVIASTVTSAEKKAVYDFIDGVEDAAADRAAADADFLARLEAGRSGITNAGTRFHVIARDAVRARSSGLPAGYRVRAEHQITPDSRLDVFVETPSGGLVEIDWKTSVLSGLQRPIREDEMGKHAAAVAGVHQRGLAVQESRSWGPAVVRALRRAGALDSLTPNQRRALAPWL